MNEEIKNIPIRKYHDSEGKVQYTGDIQPLHPNRRLRRLNLQKSENNPFYGMSFHEHASLTPQGTGLVFKNYVQWVWKELKNKFVPIIHTSYI